MCGGQVAIQKLKHQLASMQLYSMSKHSESSTTNSLTLWIWTSQPWQCIHLQLSFAGSFWEHMYLLVVDAHFKWIEVAMRTSTTKQKTSTELCKLLASFGLPEQVSDNGLQFTSSEFDVFMKCNGIKHILTAPYHPKSNRKAERAVETFKNSLKAQKWRKEMFKKLS